MGTIQGGGEEYDWGMMGMSGAHQLKRNAVVNQFSENTWVRASETEGGGGGAKGVRGSGFGHVFLFREKSSYLPYDNLDRVSWRGYSNAETQSCNRKNFCLGHEGGFESENRRWWAGEEYTFCVNHSQDSPPAHAV